MRLRTRSFFKLPKKSSASALWEQLPQQLRSVAFFAAVIATLGGCVDVPRLLLYRAPTRTRIQHKDDPFAVGCVPW